MRGGLPHAPPGALPLDPVGGFMRGAASPPRSSQRSLRVAAKAASFNSLAHWASASLFPPLAALGSRPPAAFEKSGGKPAGILLLISNRICRRAAHRERPARFVGWFWCGKGWRMDRMAGQKFQRFGRGGGRAQRAQSRSGGPWPPLLLWFCGPSGPAKRRRPPGDPPGRPVGGGGVHGPGPLALAPEQARCRAQPGSGRVGVAHPPPPPRPLEFPPTPKRQRKSQAPRSMGPGCLNDPRKGQGNGPAPLGKAAAHALRAAAA